MNNRIRQTYLSVPTKSRSLLSRLLPLRVWLSASLRCRPIRLAGYVAAGALCLALLAGLTAYAEYRTNLGARAMGRLMAATNALRRSEGAVAKRIVAQDSIMASLDIQGVEWSGSEASLPEAVAAARFEVDREMVDGLPRSLDIYRYELSDDDRRREGPEIVRSLSAYRLGLQILQSAWLPDIRYARQVADEIDRIYKSAAPPDPIPADTLVATDTTRQDSLDAGLRTRLASDRIAPLRLRDTARLIADFQAGFIYRISIGWGLARYEGEVEYADPSEHPRVTFELSLSDLAQALSRPQAAR